MVELVLFSTGHSALATRARRNLFAVLAELPSDSYELLEVDVTERPDLALEHKIIATPTLMRQSPGPIRKVIGDLSDGAGVLSLLGVSKGTP